MKDSASPQVAALLLWYGADPLLKNEGGRCALEEASDRSMKRLLKSYLLKSRGNSVSGGDDAENTLSAQSVDDINLHQISLQTDESVLAGAKLTGTGSADILQQTTVNEVQNIHIDILDDGTSCTEQTPQTNTEAILARELSAATSGESVSRSLSNSTGGALSTIEEKAPQPEKGWRILLNAEEGAGGCPTEATENANSIEIHFTALQLHENEAHQIKHKSQELQEANSKSGEGGFAGIEDIEENEEGSRKSNVFSQLTEAEEIQTKKMRLDLQETSQKTDLCSSSSKYKLSSNQSQFNQASEQLTSKKSGESKKRKKNEKGETKLHIAARRGNLSLVKTLISSGILVNEQDNAGWTALHEASNGGFTEVILELLKAGANVNSRNMDGVLPIHDAVSGNYLEAARILLQHGANPCERDSSGKSALDEACDDEMKELLKSYGAIDSVLPVATAEVTETNCLRVRRPKSCSECCKNDDAALKRQNEKSCVEFSHKATLLENGKIKTSENKILQNPVQWVKDLLGSDISVTWKYVWNKVMYHGTQLSKLLVEEVPASNDLELPSQQREPLGKNFITREPSNHTQHCLSQCTDSVALPVGSFDLSNMRPRTQTETVKALLCTGREAAESLTVTRESRRSSVQFNSVESLTQVVNETLLLRTEEFLPWSVMEKHWNFYLACEDFGF
uniref:Uncharacterized protein n=1 Tax=Anas platyrhynchos platyrhynchos TaxID=8840 RepID=U3IH61_ANAPP